MRSGLRRGLHACSPLVLVPTYWIGWEQERILLLVLAGGACALEVLRLTVPAVRRVLERVLPVWRSHEQQRPSGAAWLALAFALAARAPMPAALGGIFAGAWADPAASLVGSRFGGSTTKSAAGSAAAGIVAAGAALIVGYSLSVAVVAGAVAAMLERWAVSPDDNLWLASGGALALAGFP